MRVNLRKTDDASDLTVVEVIHAFWRHADGFYRNPDGSPAGELDKGSISDPVAWAGGWDEQAAVVEFDGSRGSDQRTRLGEVKVETWGGWIWINLDPDSEPLREFFFSSRSRMPIRVFSMRRASRKAR